MRGRHSAAVAVRLTSGNILLHEEQLSKKLYASRVAQWPFVRGLLLLWDMLILGTRMMMFAATASLAPSSPSSGGTANLTPSPSPTGRGESGAGTLQRIESDRTAGGQPTITETTPRDMEGIGGAGMALTLTVSLAFAIALFFLLPLAIVGAAHDWLGGGWLSLTAEGVIRLALLIGYLAVIGRVATIERVFEYHGAEHKAINCYEAGQLLDVEHVRQASRVHTRCGTGFLLIVVVVSIVVFAVIGAPALPVRIASRVVLVPVIASIAYELMRLGAANYRYRVVRWLMAPSLALQGLTTREPDDTQMECAIVALKRVLRADGVSALERVA
jgi:uncharacterized protein YqhQ